MTRFQTILRGANRGYSMLGLLLPAPLVAMYGVPSTRQLLLGLVVALVAIASDRLTVEFSFGGEEIPVTPDVVAWVIAAVYLPPELAMVVALASIASGWGSPLKSLLLNAGSLAISLGIASWIAHSIDSFPTGMMTLFVGMVAAIAFEVAYVLDGLAYLESNERGAAREHLRHAEVVTGFEVFLPTMGVALVGPFIKQPLLAAVVLVSYQVVTYLGLRVMKSEQVHKATSHFLKDTFSRYVPASVVDELTDEQASLTLGGEEITISVMFCDIRNFTAWSENLSPTELITNLNELMTELAEGVFATQGTLDKFTGDGLMAFWGAPLRQPDHATRAVKAALDMLRRVDAYNERKAAEGGRQLAIGIGIHTGNAVIGNVGHVDRLDYTAIGDTVNLSARLEAATKDAGCAALISADTYAALDVDSGVGPLELLGDLFVKGRTMPVETYILAHGMRIPGSGFGRGVPALELPDLQDAYPDAAPDEPSDDASLDAGPRAGHHRSGARAA